MEPTTSLGSLSQGLTPLLVRAVCWCSLTQRPFCRETRETGRFSRARLSCSEGFADFQGALGRQDGLKGLGWGQQGTLKGKYFLCMKCPRFHLCTIPHVLKVLHWKACLMLSHLRGRASKRGHPEKPMPLVSLVGFEREGCDAAVAFDRASLLKWVAFRCFS